jgi:hypothetical protein
MYIRGYNVCERWVYLALKIQTKIGKDDSRDEKLFLFVFNSVEEKNCVDHKGKL